MLSSDPPRGFLFKEMNRLPLVASKMLVETIQSCARFHMRIASLFMRIKNIFKIVQRSQSPCKG